MRLPGRHEDQIARRLGTKHTEKFVKKPRTDIGQLYYFTCEQRDIVRGLDRVLDFFPGDIFLQPIRNLVEVDLGSRSVKETTGPPAMSPKGSTAAKGLVKGVQELGEIGLA